MKKGLLKGLCVCGVVTTVITIYPLRATDFEGQEDMYMEICASTELTASDAETCKEFNEYLKNKNEQVKEEISQSKKEIETLETDIQVVADNLSQLGKEIVEKENEVTYLNTSISNLEASIQVREVEIHERLYAMQTYLNSNFYVDFIFGAENFTDMISRIDSVNELSAYDKQLISGLVSDKQLLEDQSYILSTARYNLERRKNQQQTLQNQYTVMLHEKNEVLIAQENLSNELEENSSSVAQALEELAERTKATEIIGNVTITGDSEIGKSIAEFALSQRSKPYTWGATGPDSYDCSGLVYWAFNQAGINIGRTTASGYSNYGVEINLSDAQAGDIVTFYNYGYISHIGIIIDNNGTMVHAAGRENEYMGQWGGNVRVNSVYDFPGTIYNCKRMY